MTGSTGLSAVCLDVPNLSCTERVISIRETTILHRTFSEQRDSLDTTSRSVMIVMDSSSLIALAAIIASVASLIWAVRRKP
jgi:hypothetical protein